MFSRSLAKDLKSLKNQFLNISKIHPWHCGCIRVSDKPCIFAVDRKTAIPAGRPSPWSWCTKSSATWFHPAAQLNRQKIVQIPGISWKKWGAEEQCWTGFFCQCCIFVPYPWTWYISFNVAVSYIYPNYSDLTRPHPKWRCGRGTPQQLALFPGNQGWWTITIRPDLSSNKHWLSCLNSTCSNKVKLSSSLTNPENRLNMTIVKVVGWFKPGTSIFFTMGNNHHHHHPSMPNATDQPRLKQEGEPEGKWKRPEVGQRGEERFNGFSGGSGFLQRFFCCKEFIGENDGKWMGWESPPRKKSVPRKISHLYGIYWIYIYISYHISSIPMPIHFFVSTVDGSAMRPNTSWEAGDTYVEMSQKSGVASNGSIFMYLQRSIFLETNISHFKGYVWRWFSYSPGGIC